MHASGFERIIHDVFFCEWSVGNIFFLRVSQTRIGFLFTGRCCGRDGRRLCRDIFVRTVLVIIYLLQSVFDHIFAFGTASCCRKDRARERQSRVLVASRALQSNVEC